jgi:hypothetical protein
MADPHQPGNESWTADIPIDPEGELQNNKGAGYGQHSRLAPEDGQCGGAVRLSDLSEDLVDERCGLSV